MRTKEEEEEEEGDGAGVSVVRVEACTMLRSAAASRNKRITTRHDAMLAVISCAVWRDARARIPVQEGGRGGGGTCYVQATGINMYGT